MYIIIHEYRNDTLLVCKSICICIVNFEQIKINFEQININNEPPILLWLRR